MAVEQVADAHRPMLDAIRRRLPLFVTRTGIGETILRQPDPDSGLVRALPFHDPLIPVGQRLLELGDQLASGLLSEKFAQDARTPPSRRLAGHETTDGLAASQHDDFLLGKHPVYHLPSWLGGGHVVWRPDEHRVVEACGEAWRYLAWHRSGSDGRIERLPAEHFGPLPAPRRLASRSPT